MPNSPERFKKLKRMAKLLQDNLPVVLTSTPVVSGLVQKRVRNFKRNIMLTGTFKYLDIKN